MCFSLQIEDLDILLSDHIQKVLKVNFSAAWEEVTAKNELEDTYAFNLKTLDGKKFFSICFLNIHYKQYWLNENFQGSFQT